MTDSLLSKQRNKILEKFVDEVGDSALKITKKYEND